MKKLIFCTTVVGALAAHAQTITWQTPQVISGTSDVSTNGTYFGSWAPGDGGANGDPVNGVSFQGNSDLPGFSTTGFDNSYNGYGSPGTTDANYDALLAYAAYDGGSGSASISWSGMTPGAAYEVEFWVEDVRGGFERWETLSGGALTNAVYGTDTSDPVGYNSPLFSGSTNSGYYIIGTFVADGAGSEEILVTPFAGGASSISAQVNLVQVRAVPAATILGSLNVSPAYTNDAGTTVTISAAVTGNPPISFQWQSNGANIDGATNSALTFTATDPSQSAPVTNTYDLVVSNSSGTNTSATVTLTTDPAAAAGAVTNEPPPGALFLGNNVTLSYAISGTSPVWVEWELNGTPIGTFTNIGEATTASLTVSNLQASQGGAYSIIATNQFTTSATNSQAYNLTVNPFTQFTWYASGHITSADATLELFGGATNPAVVYGATGFGDNATTVTLDDGQSITFEPSGTVASGNGTIYVGDFGIWTGSSGNVDFDAVLDGNNTGLMANASSISFLNLTSGNLYGIQIFSLDDRAGNGAPDLVDFQDPNDTTNISPAFLEGANDYALGTFVASGTNQEVILQLPGLTAGGDVLNAAVVYSLPSAPEVWDTLTASPSTNVYAGTAVTLNDALITGLPPFSYQWQANGVNIPNATNSVLTFTATNTSENLVVTNSYALVVANSSGTNTSALVAIAISPAAGPVVTTNEPPPAAVFLGDSVTLSYSVNGTPPLWVEWELNGTPIGTFTNIGEATTTSLTLSALQASQGGNYTVIVTNQFGTNTSPAISLTVHPYTQFTWYAPGHITTADATLGLFGKTNYAGAVDFAEVATTVTLADGTNIDFTGDQSVASTPGNALYGSFAGTITGNASFDAVLDGGNYAGGPKPITITEALTPGNLYAVQLFAIDDRGFNQDNQGVSITNRQVYFQDPADTANVSQTYVEGANDFVLGTFVANGTNQIIIEQLPGITSEGTNNADINAGNINALVFYSLPKAATAWYAPVAIPSADVFSGTAVTLSEPAITGIPPVTGIPPISYQWQSNGVDIIGATNSELTFTATDTTADSISNSYTLVVANTFGTNAKSIALTVNPAAAPVVTTNEPSPVALFLGDGVTLEFAVNGTPPVWVEWELNGAPIGTFTNIGEAATASLTLTGLQASQGGAYTVIATNQFGTNISPAIDLTVNPYTQFTWYATGHITTAEATLGLFGGATNPAVVFGATDFGNTPTTVNLDDGQSITFEPNGTVASGNGTIYVGNFGIWTGSSGNADFDTVLDGNNTGLMANASSITFLNLTPGNLYGLQIFSVDDRSGVGAPDLVDFQDPNDAANISPAFLDGANDYALGTFVASDTNQIVTLQLPGLTAGGDILNAAVVYSLPLAANAWLAPAASPGSAVPSGTSVTLSDALVTGIPPFSYQWQSNGVDIPGATNSVLLLANVLDAQSGNYDLVVANHYGTNTSPALALKVENEPNFNINGQGWTANGAASITNDLLTLTDGNAAEASSFFFDTPMYIGAFAASFTYQDVGGGGADGFTFCLQDEGPAAVGLNGGELGYGGIAPSAAVDFNIYSGGTGKVGYAFSTNGVMTASGPPQGYTPTGSVNMASGDPINVGITYDGSQVTLTLADATVSASFTTNITVGSLQSTNILGASTAYVGFTAGTGSAFSTQTVTNFTFTPLVALSAELALTNNMLAISWPAAVGGYVLQSTTNLTQSWTTVPPPYTIANGEVQVTVPATSGAFYRLQLTP